MNKCKRFGLTLFLSSVMLAGSVTTAFAATSDFGPAFDPRYGGTPNTTEGSMPTPIDSTTPGQPSQDGTSGPDGTAVSPDGGEGNSALASDLAQEQAEAAAAAAADDINNPLSVPHRTPRLQTTVLLNDVLAWSDPFVNDQFISVDGRQFYSISTFIEGIHGDCLYRTYTSAHGWTNWVMHGQETNRPADFAPVEAIQYRFSGPVNDQYDIYYRTSLSNGVQTGWAKNGATSGTMNQGMYLTGFQLAFYPKGQGPATDGSALSSAHADGIQYIDGVLRYIHGDGSNFTGWGWLGNDRYYFVDSYPVTGWQYIDGYKYYFSEDGRLVTDVESLLGSDGPYQIKINKEMNCMTIYAQDGGNGFIIPVKSFLTSTGEDTPLGTFQTPEKYRWRLMIHDVYTQYATRLGSGLRILIHSIIYDAPNPYTVWASTYNNLGIARSAGCIRLSSADAKWVYDHCALGTSVTVYNSSVPGPFERPTITAEIPFEQTWDPTDPNTTPEGIAAETARIMAAFGYN